VRIFIDANILFSAADRASVTRELFTNTAEHAELVTNPHAWEEASRNLSYKKTEHLSGMNDLKKHLVITSAFGHIDKTVLPQHDAPILAGAVGACCTHIWTSDKKHFGTWYGKKINDITILSSILLADILIKRGWKP
jgi:predicted nucleic acid-binding protein